MRDQARLRLNVINMDTNLLAELSSTECFQILVGEEVYEDRVGASVERRDEHARKS